MSQWQERWPEARPRWGTYSVRAHTDLGRLISDALLYDVLVFPCPEDKPSDYERWREQGWDPDLLELRVIQLGDAAVTVPWSEDLRTVWANKYGQLSEEQRNDPEIAYDLTSWQMSTRSFLTLMGERDDRIAAAALDPPKIHPRYAEYDGRTRAQAGRLELVAAYQRSWEALCFAGVSEASGGAEATATDPYQRFPNTGARLRLRLAVPDEADDEMFFRTLDTIGDADFQHARRRRWSWEEGLSADADIRETQLRLKALMEDYNAAVGKQIKTTRLKTVFVVVPVGAGLVVDQLLTGGIGHTLGSAAVSVGIDRVKAHFPVLSGEAERASHHPGSAVGGMLSVVSSE